MSGCNAPRSLLAAVTTGDRESWLRERILFQRSLTMYAPVNPNRVTFHVARVLLRHASRLDAAGCHAEADFADRAAQSAALRAEQIEEVTNAEHPVSHGPQPGEPLSLLGAMRAQVASLLSRVRLQQDALAPTARTLAEKLVTNVLERLTVVEKNLLAAERRGPSGNAAPSITSQPAARVRAVPPGRIANAAGSIESYTRAALQGMQCLAHPNRFPGGPDALQHITRNLQSLVALLSGRVSPEAVANQITISEEEQIGRATGTGQTMLADEAEGVRQSLGKGAETSPASGG